MRRVPASKDSLPCPSSATQMRPKVALSQHVDSRWDVGQLQRPAQRLSSTPQPLQAGRGHLRF
jgi:hypothetical protein